MSVIACIGSGNMGCALMKGISKEHEIIITDSVFQKAKDAAASLGVKTAENNTKAAQAGDIIFLAVKPQILKDVLNEISPVLKNRLEKGGAPLLVSMAAGWTVAKIQEAIGLKTPVIRIMPNTPALVGKGMIVMSASPETPEQKINETKKILGAAGIVDVLEEKFMDAVTGLSGSGPAYVYIFIEALADGAVRAGLPRDKALSYAAQTVFGASAMVKETGKHPGELKDMVASPGGTTIAGISALEEGAFRSTIIKAVEAAWKRSIELG
ncbi:MAG: pyrroline-5-carboxylate reductase [Treponema sp.]|nr:pyrroline-5-carboxylate reductase [Treponema sp.]